MRFGYENKVIWISPTDDNVKGGRERIFIFSWKAETE